MACRSDCIDADGLTEVAADSLGANFGTTVAAVAIDGAGAMAADDAEAEVLVAFTPTLTVPLLVAALPLLDNVEPATSVGVMVAAGVAVVETELATEAETEVTMPL